MPTDDLSKAVLTNLDAIVRLLAIQLTGRLKPLEAMTLLERTGLDRKTIAEICDTTPATVRSTLSRAKKKRPRKRPTQPQTEGA
jgi:DNA-directed RNA polymerase specialized sigma24 family protein